VVAACAARHPDVASRILLGSFQARTHPRLQALSVECLELIERGRAREEMADFFIRGFGAGLSENFRETMRRQFAGLTEAQIQQMRRQSETLAAGGDLRDVVDLKRVTARVLVVNGTEDPLVDLDDHVTTGGCFTNSEITVIPGVGHFLHLERPSLIDLYIDFIRGAADEPGAEPSIRPARREGAPMLTELQKQKLTHLFNVLDSDRNGYLEPEDARLLAHAIAEARGLRPGSGQYEVLQRRYRESMASAVPFADAAGRLNLDAFFAYHDWLLNTPGSFQLVVQRLAEFVFYALDGDGDGEVTRDEARLFYTAHGIDAEASDAIFARIDLDGDGFLTFAEATDIVTQFFFSSDPGVPGNWLFGPFLEGQPDAVSRKV
jgi:hypothetical protein